MEKGILHIGIFIFLCFTRQIIFRLHALHFSLTWSLTIVQHHCTLLLTGFSQEEIQDCDSKLSQVTLKIQLQGWQQELLGHLSTPS